jgi:hypothetical protein
MDFSSKNVSESRTLESYWKNAVFIYHSSNAASDRLSNFLSYVVGFFPGPYCVKNFLKSYYGENHERMSQSVLNFLSMDVFDYEKPAAEKARKELSDLFHEEAQKYTNLTGDMPSKTLAMKPNKYWNPNRQQNLPNLIYNK